MKLEGDILGHVGNHFGFRTRKSNAAPAINHPIADAKIARIGIAAFRTDEMRKVHPYI